MAFTQPNGIASYLGGCQKAIFWGSRARNCVDTAIGFADNN
jgi:hypothetical protein